MEPKALNHLVVFPHEDVGAAWQMLQGEIAQVKQQPQSFLLQMSFNFNVVPNCSIRDWFLYLNLQRFTEKHCNKLGSLLQEDAQLQSYRRPSLGAFCLARFTRKHQTEQLGSVKLINHLNIIIRALE